MTGAIRWTPREFLESELADTLIAFDGAIKEQIRQERIWRKHAEFVIAPYAGKNPPSMLKMWPIAGDDEFKEKVKEITSKRNLSTLEKHKAKGASESLKERRRKDKEVLEKLMQQKQKKKQLGSSN
jgi:hypothetical protein